MSKDFNECTRVQIPAILHLSKLGYKFIDIYTEEYKNQLDIETNILKDEFVNSFKNLNNTNDEEAREALKEVKKFLEIDDFGRKFYERLTNYSPNKFIDFENAENNSFKVCAELEYKNGDAVFRPDATLYINGLPLVFLEFKIPNNTDGMVAEQRRITERILNKKFSKFFNITQLMIFSNNQAYGDNAGINPTTGSYYATPTRLEKNYTNPDSQLLQFNCFREENKNNNNDIPLFIKNYSYQDVDDTTTNSILKLFSKVNNYNYLDILNSTEFKTNDVVESYCNMFLTSMCSKERLLFLLKYSIVYVKSEYGAYDKHIMRYQQFFASLAVRDRILSDNKSGVIWHTQGSGKTALAFFLTRILKDSLYQNERKNAKFYFIVDRIDLLQQASKEFEKRGLHVTKISSRGELKEELQSQKVINNARGEDEIFVVNIQKFSKQNIDLSDQDENVIENEENETSSFFKNLTLDPNLQRIFIVDEAHRSYSAQGSFLKALLNADPKAIKIALTGTPLLSKDSATKKIFGNYIHTYFYDQSTEDGYTLKIYREPIKTIYKNKLEESLNEINIKNGSINKATIYENPIYIEELLKTTIKDFHQFRKNRNDNTLGAMFVAYNSQQAKKFYSQFNKVQEKLINKGEIDPEYKLKPLLVLYDEDREQLDKNIKKYKYGSEYDFIIVYCMLLTGFDAPKLKKMYLHRRLQGHTLLQAITRINRRYKNLKSGYLVDFVDIEQSFDKTTVEYQIELNNFKNPDNTEQDDIYVQVVKSDNEIINILQSSRSVIDNYFNDNREDFRYTLDTIKDKSELLQLKNSLISFKDWFYDTASCTNKDIIELRNLYDINKIKDITKLVQNKIDMLNLTNRLELGDDIKDIIQNAIRNIEIKFIKRFATELDISSIADSSYKELENFYKDFEKVNNDLCDPEDEEVNSIYNQIIKILQEIHAHGFDNSHIIDIDSLYEKLHKLMELNTKDQKNYQTFGNDLKFLKVYKKINKYCSKHTNIVRLDEKLLCELLLSIKQRCDEDWQKRKSAFEDEEYKAQDIQNFLKRKIKYLEIDDSWKEFSSQLSLWIAEEYKNTLKGK